MHIWKHFSTITRHRHKVIHHCAKAGIFWQGLRHDLSKYSPTEFIAGVKNYLGDKSPNEKERSVTVSQGHGCTTREGISIILNTGWTTARSLNLQRAYRGAHQVFHEMFC